MVAIDSSVLGSELFSIECQESSESFAQIKVHIPRLACLKASSMLLPQVFEHGYYHEDETVGTESALEWRVVAIENNELL